MNVSFVEASEFTSAWRRLRMEDDDLLELQKMLAKSPLSGKPMRGTGGLRKIRFAAAGSGRGKSGGERVLYAYFDRAGLIYLIGIFAKNQKKNIDRAEAHQYRELLQRLAKTHKEPK